MGADRELSIVGRLLVGVARGLWTSIVVVVPTVGVWVGSSIAAYLNGPVWAACVAGLLLFPGLPLGWEWLARRRHRQKRWHREALTRWDRIVLRTLVVNLVFLTALLWRSPETAFTAVSTRGDWVLDRVEHPIAARVRPWFFRASDGLAWLYELAHDNEYEQLVSDDAKAEDEPRPRVRDDAKPPPAALEPGGWPQPATLHPLITNMPASAMASPEAVGAYIRAHEPDPHGRIKAIHDFVADHVAYDAPALRDGVYPPQDAETVFRTGLAVCAGYANLAKQIADASGDHVIVIVGDSRERGGGIAGGGHAWNAARVEDEWFLFDATWDAGWVEGRRFVKDYQTGYLFPPPEVIGVTHFPQDPAWQLRAQPIGRGEFARQPMMRPRFFAQGFSLLSPQRSQLTVADQLAVELANPQRLFLLASYAPTTGGEGQPCEVPPPTDASEASTIACTFPTAGSYHVSLFSSAEQYGTYDFLGEIEVNAKG